MFTILIVQLLEDTLAVPSLGKLCGKHGYSYEWASGQKPQLTKSGKRILRKTEKFVPVVVKGLSSSSGASSSSEESSSTSSSPARTRIDEDASGNRRDHTTTHNQNDKRDNEEAAGNRLQDLPEYLEEFTDDLEDTEVPTSAKNPHDSDSEHPIKVASRKHSVYAHFPKDRNCEGCKRTKMTRLLAVDTLAKEYLEQKSLVT